MIGAHAGRIDGSTNRHESIVTAAGHHPPPLDDVNELEAVRAFASRLAKTTLECYNCGELGHGFRTCPELDTKAPAICPICSGPHCKSMHEKSMLMAEKRRGRGAATGRRATGGPTRPAPRKAYVTEISDEMAMESYDQMIEASREILAGDNDRSVYDEDAFADA